MDGEPQQVRFAVLNCRSWTANHWEAMRLIAEENDLDFVANLGDYIYGLTRVFEMLNPLNVELVVNS